MESAKQMRIVRDICKKVHDRWRELCVEYSIPGTPLTIVEPFGVVEDRFKFFSDWRRFNETIMMTIGSNIVSNNVIVSIEAGVMVNYNELLASFIDYDLNVDLSMEHFDTVMRHEIGHIKHQLSFIGKKHDEYLEMERVSLEEHEKLPKLRSNPSPKTIFEYIVAYSNIPQEKAADEAAGITTKDWAKDFVLANPGYSRKKLGVDKYLTEEEFREIRKEGKEKRSR